jgi:5'-nucleotidase
MGRSKGFDGTQRYLYRQVCANINKLVPLHKNYSIPTQKHIQVKSPLILLTNDDGIRAKGLRALLEMARPLGRLIVVAPEEVQSAQSHAVTSRTPLRLRPVADYCAGVQAYACSGTPADCVKIAMSQLLGAAPDITLSGINHGSNSSTSALYSGTVAAAQEGALYGSIAAAFSLVNDDADADFEHCITIGRRIVEWMMRSPLHDDAFVSVNIPANPVLKGIKATRLANGRWREEYVKRTDPNGGEYYWLTGSFENYEPDAEDTDEWALRHGYVSVTPIGWDVTSHAALPMLNSIKSLL